MLNINILDTVHGHRGSRTTTGKRNVYSLVANFLPVKMCHGLSSFLHTRHTYKTNTGIVWKHLHSDVEYLAFTSRLCA